MARQPYTMSVNWQKALSLCTLRSPCQRFLPWRMLNGLQLRIPRAAMVRLPNGISVIILFVRVVIVSVPKLIVIVIVIADSAAVPSGGLCSFRIESGIGIELYVSAECPLVYHSTVSLGVEAMRLPCVYCVAS